MKVIFILSLVLASALCELSFDRDSSENEERRTRHRPIPLQRQQQFVSSGERNRDLSEDSNVLTPSALNTLMRQSTQASNQSKVPAHGTLGLWATYPDAAAFDAKIKMRLETSKILSTKPEVLNKLTELAEEKFNLCKGMVEDRERACLGRATGQIMQLIAAVENMHRNSQ